MKDPFMKDYNGMKVFSLEYDKETLKDMVLEKQEKLEKLEKFIKNDLISNLCEIENKRIGYGQTEVDKIWLHNLWGFKSYIINECNNILNKE